MSKADAGQILSTAIVLERSRTTFETTPIEPFRAKGKANLVHASVVGASHRRPGGQATETPLIGRNAELGALLEVLRRGRAGRTAGSSRSAASRARAVAAGPGADRPRAPTCAVLHAHCEEYESLTPYFPFRAPMFTVLGLEPSADSARGRGAAAEAVEQARSDARAVAAAARDPARPRPPADAGDGATRRAIPPRDAGRRDDAIPRLEPRRDADDARRRGRALHGRREHGSAAPALEGRRRAPATALVISHTDSSTVVGVTRTRTCAACRSRSCL